MSSFEGRDLSSIISHGERIRAADTLRVDGQPQTMFGAQIYWAHPWWQESQAKLLGEGQSITGAQAIERVVAKAAFPIQVGLTDNPDGTSPAYKAPTDGAEAPVPAYREHIEAAARAGVSWLWWDWRNGALDAPLNGQACRDYVLRSPAGFAGAGKG